MPIIITIYQRGSWLAMALSRVRDVAARSCNEQAAAALASSVELATQRYVGGRANYYEVLQAQQEFCPTQRAEVRARVGELIAIIQLYKALGGGWQLRSSTAGVLRD